MEIRVKLLNDKAKLPKKAYTSDLGIDIFSCENKKIEPGKVNIIHTGIVVQPIQNYGFLLKERSSYARRYGVQVIGGVIDSGYRGEIIVMMTTIEPFEVAVGDKIAQMIPIETKYIDINITDNIYYSDRKDKGFGSTGK